MKSRSDIDKNGDNFPKGEGEEPIPDLILTRFKKGLCQVLLRCFYKVNTSYKWGFVRDRYFQVNLFPFF